MICYRSRGALFREYWFDDDSPSNDDHVDVLAYRERSSPIESTQITPILTLVSDLARDPDTLLGRFDRKCRSKVTRADRHDELWMEFATTPQARLEEFCAFYDTFAKQKSLPGCDRIWLQAACDANCLALATVWRGGEPLVRHAYVVGADTIRVQYSASLFRTKDREEQDLVSRANRWLHWRSMACFGERGALFYDWGGMFEDESIPEQAGINRFKRDFGGRPVRRYDCVVARSARGHARLGIRRMADGWRHIAARIRTARAPRHQHAQPPARAKPEATSRADS